MGGALPGAELVAMLEMVGFAEPALPQRFDCIRGTPGEVVARMLGVAGVNVRALKPRARSLTAGGDVHQDR